MVFAPLRGDPPAAALREMKQLVPGRATNDSWAAIPWRWRWLARYVRAELPGWGQIYERAIARRGERWRDAGFARVRGKLHGYTMDLDLANWSERLTWFLGRYHDLPIQLAFQQVLRPGDCFVDVGANIGMLTLLARRLVGDTGRVVACEPNPPLRTRIDALVRDNNLANVDVVGTALGEQPGTAELHEYSGHTGWGSLAASGPAGAAATKKWQVPVARGDDVLAHLDGAQPMAIKIDVEGFEVPVLRGLAETLRTRWPLVFVEVADAHQRRAGFSAKELRDQLEGIGYRAFALHLRRRRLFGRALAMAPLMADATGEIDALFVPTRGPVANRL